MSQRNQAFLVVIAAFLVAMLACNSPAPPQEATSTSSEPIQQQAASIDDGFEFYLDISVAPLVGETRKCIELSNHLAVKVDIKASPGLRFDTTPFPKEFDVQLLGFTGDSAEVKVNEFSQVIQRGLVSEAGLDMVGRSDWNAKYQFKANVPLVVYLGSQGTEACFEIQKIDFRVSGVPKPE